jgi:hypothetical protein
VFLPECDRHHHENRGLETNETERAKANRLFFPRTLDPAIAPHSTATRISRQSPKAPQAGRAGSELTTAQNELVLPRDRSLSGVSS